MEAFNTIFFSFPTVIFSFFLCISVVLSLIALLGLIDLDFLSVDTGAADVSADTGLESSGESVGAAGALTGFLMRFGLAAIPFPLLLMSLSMFGWLISFLASYFIYPLIPVWIIQLVIGVAILCVATYLAAWITGKVFKPLQPVFMAMTQEHKVEIIGKVGVVRTTRVDQNFGEAVIEDGGAGLILKVRTFSDEVFTRGDRVVLIEKVDSENIYKVISEESFKHGDTMTSLEKPL